MKNPRRLAFESLKKCEADGKYSNLEVTSRLCKNDLDERDRGLYTALVYGVIEKKITLDTLILTLSDRKVLDKDTLTALRLGLYQILFMDRIPDHAAINESVSLVKSTSRAPFVNAVLRRAVREKESLAERLVSAGESAVYSFPEWIIELWREGYGEERKTALLEAFSKKPPVTLRVNTLKITPDALLEKLPSAEKHPFADDILVLREGGVEKLYGYEEGLFFVQGTSSRVAVKALGLAGGERVIDTCACPGGKSFTAAIDMGNKGEIFSFDLHRSKLSLIEKGAKRLGLDIISADENNAYFPKEVLIGTADAVICDVPCSGLGIVAKKPDIKYKEREEIERLPEIQKKILEKSVLYLKKGGRLLYSTCTLNPRENERVTDAFLKENEGYKRLGSPTTVFAEEGYEDGFFYDIIVKE